MVTDIKLSKAQKFKISLSGGSFGSWLAKLEKIALVNVDISLGRYNLPGLLSSLT